MSNSFSSTGTPTGQRTFYGDPQHESSHVDDQDIFCAAEPRENEREMYVHTDHYTVADDDFVRAETESHLVRAA
ncbi:hypothetical protein [Haloferax sp. YSMS24]|uniref:hypothetical protein n=1 Tax=Haloferax sp. YSMS24 TaxID=3388425 RepID=UPI00398D3BD1